MALATGLLLVSTSAKAEPDYFGKSGGDDIKIRLDKPRTGKQRIVIGALLGGAVVFGGLGVGFHLDSRSVSDELGAKDFTGLVYTREREDLRRRGVRSRAIAIGGYAVGGVLLISTVVALLVTQPGTELLTIDSQPVKTPVSLVPLRDGGAVVSGAWSF